MSHARQQIREEIRLQLIDISATSGRVYISRVYPIDELPAISIYIDSDNIIQEESGIGGDILKQVRIADIRIEVRDRAAINADNSIDNICIEVESNLVGDLTLGGISHYINLAGTNFEFDGESSAPAIVATMRYQCYYRVSASDPETPIQ